MYDVRMKIFPLVIVFACAMKLLAGIVENRLPPIDHHPQVEIYRLSGNSMRCYLFTNEGFPVMENTVIAMDRKTGEFEGRVRCW